MWNRIRILMCYVVGTLGIVACTGGPQSIPSTGGDPAIVPQTIEELAGVWEYVDSNGSFPLKLDDQGRGDYDWKQGHFETIELKDGVWKGKWYQAENDREGKFELIFFNNSPVAQGKWWYTRIGSDANPLAPGGEFSLKALPGVRTTGK
ncbi:MAG: hypothetical protein AB7P17_12260 [Nitrospirales bacterium]|nr:hypothetical protein [Nitrospirales bacterium]